MKKSWIQKGIVGLIILAIFIAPISAGIKVDKNNNLAVNVDINKAEATDLVDCFKTSTFKVDVTNNSVIFDYKIIIHPDEREAPEIRKCNSLIKGFDTPEINSLDKKGREEGLFLFYYETAKKDIINFSFKDLGLIYSTTDPENPKEGTPGYITPPERFNFKPNTKYTAGLAIIESCWGAPYIGDDGTIKGGYVPSLTCVFSLDDTNNSIIKTSTFTTPSDFIHKEVSYQDYANTQTSGGNVEFDLTCGIGFWPLQGSLAGCIGQIFFLVWSVSSWIAKLAASFLDFFIYYATDSASYANTFVEKAWAAVRDIANIFFIIALLYVAIKTILGLNVTDNKKLIGAVIIVGLIINFSLFTTKVVIDGSNILAKVFYNNIISKDSNGKVLTGEAGGQKSISIGLVDKFNPQKLISQEAYQNMGIGKFIFILFLLILILLYTAYIFLSIAFLFVSRVVSLWLYMIFSPIAFASYTVPFDIPGFGHKEWWGELTKNALLAPIFIFFLYIIVMFADFLKEISYSSSDSSFGEIMSVVIPFFILFVLLNKAKELAEKYAGEMGKMVKGLGGAVIGAAIGGAALGTAVIGRKTIGGFMKGASTGDTAARRMEGGDDRIAAHRATLANPNSTIVERTHARKEIRREQKDQIKGNIQRAIGLHGAQTWVGERLNQNQHNIEHAAHARHDLDTAANVVVPGKKWEELNGEQRTTARANMERDRIVRDNAGNTPAPELIPDPHHPGQMIPNPSYVPGLEGLGTRKWDALTTEERAAINAIIGYDIHAPGGMIPDGRLATNQTRADLTTIQEARTKQGIISNVIQSGVTGSYDIRDLSKVIAKEQSTGFSKIAAGLTGALALGLRSGLKSSLNANYGEGQKDFTKDLGHTITEALKGVKINVDLSHVGEQKKEEHKGGGSKPASHGKPTSGHSGH